MKERSILFSAPMVRANLEDRKNQTRRVMKPQPSADTNLVDYNTPAQAFVPWRWSNGPSYGGGHRTGDPIRCPYGQPGDRLVMLSSWATDARFDGLRPKDLPIDGDDAPTEWGKATFWTRWNGGEKPAWCGKLRPGRFLPSSLRWMMPRAEIVQVRVERVQDISEEDARAEGVEDLDYFREAPDFDRAVCRECGGTRLHLALGPDLGVTEADCSHCDTYRKRFRNLWHHISPERPMSGSDRQYLRERERNASVILLARYARGRELVAALPPEVRAERDALVARLRREGAESGILVRRSLRRVIRAIECGIDLVEREERETEDSGAALPACRECSSFDPCEHDAGGNQR